MSSDIIPPNGMGRPRDSMCEAHGIMFVSNERCKDVKIELFMLACNQLYFYGLIGRMPVSQENRRFF